MRTKLTQQLGVDKANCLNCKLCTNESGIYECLGYQPKANLKSFPFKKEQLCWVPSFWHTDLVMYLTDWRWWNNIIYSYYEDVSGEAIGSQYTKTNKLNNIVKLWFGHYYYKTRSINHTQGD